MPRKGHLLFCRIGIILKSGNDMRKKNKLLYLLKQQLLYNFMPAAYVLTAPEIPHRYHFSNKFHLIFI
jgi:hypothetical protein